MAQSGDQGRNFVAGQLTALPGLGPLGDFDLDLLGTAQVGGSDSEAPRRDLLDLGVFEGAETDFVLTALTRVAPSADAVHRLGETLVGFGRDRSQAHRRGTETLEDRFDRLHFVDENRSPIALEFEEVADELLVPGFDAVFEDRVVLFFPADGRLVDCMDRRRSKVVVLGPVDVFVKAADVEREDPVRRLQVEGFGVKTTDTLLDLSVAQSLEQRIGFGKAFGDDLVPQPDDVEEHRVAVAGDRRDAHFRHNLEQTGVDRRANLFQNRSEVDVGIFAPFDLRDGLEEHIGMNGRSAEGQHRGGRVRIVNLSGHGDDAHKVADSRIEKGVIEAADNHQHRHCHIVLGECMIVEDDETDAPLFNLRNDLIDQLVEAGAQIAFEARIVAFGFVSGVVLRIALPTEFFENDQLLVAENRRDGFESFGVLGVVGENVVDLSEAGVETHHHPLPDRVDGGVGHLGEFLTEKVGEIALLVAEGRQRCIVSHRGGRLLTLFEHRLDHLLDHFERNVEVALARLHHLRGRNLHRGERIVHMLLEIDHIFCEPLTVGKLRLEIRIDILIFENGTVFEIQAHHLPGLQAAAFDDLFVGDLQHAVFGGDQQTPVFGDDVLGGAQAVAVQNAADVASVGHTHRRGTVPGLEACAGVFVESPQIGVHMRRILPGGGDHRPGGFEKVDAVDP